jgi:hypothetical protein
VISADDNCRFPSAWHGTWYESEIGQLTITPTNITRKGHCIQRVDNYYMLENLLVHVYHIALFHLFTSLSSYAEGVGGENTPHALISAAIRDRY